MRWQWPNSFGALLLLPPGLEVRILAGCAGLAAVASYFFSSGPLQFPFDDSYITLEFARNFAAFGRFTYDGTRPAPGATSPLHVLLLALPARLGVPLEAADSALGTLFFVLLVERTGALAWRLTRSRQAALFAAVVTALSGYLVYDALNGLETTLFIFLSVAWAASLLAFLDAPQTSGWPALWLFLAMLTRPEALWLAGSVVLFFLCRAARAGAEHARLGVLLASLVGAVIGALAVQWLLTGSVTSHTALAKVYLFGDFRKPFGARLRIFWYGLREVWSPLYFFLLLGFWARRSRTLVWMLLPWAVMTEVLFCLLLPGQVATYWGRYQHPLMPFVFILAGDGMETLARWLARTRTGRWATAVLLALAAMLCVINLREFRANLRDDKQVIFDNHFRAVEWLREHAPAGARVATHDIGVLRYRGGYNLVDVSGLTNLEAYARNRAGSGQFEYLARERPDYLIGIDFWLEGYLRYFPQLNCCATRVAQATPRTPTSIRLSIYRCRWEGLTEAHPPPGGNSRRR